MTHHGQGGLSGRSDAEKYVLGKDGKPLIDRYGRPVLRRSRSQEAPRPEQRPAQRPPRRPSPQAASQHPPQRRPRQHYADPAAVPPPVRQRRPRREEQVVIPQQRAAAPPPQRARSRRRRSGPGCLSIVGWFIAIALVAAIVLVLWTDARLNRVDAAPPVRVPATSGTNWLLVGSDSRHGFSEEEAQILGTGGDIGVSRTDTIMLLHLPNSGPARLISIPRDSYVPVPGYGEDKINAAFAYGGAPLLVETVEQSTGVHIDHYAEIGMGGLAQLVDAVGGITICVEQPIFDPLANLDVQAGCQEMDGPTALGYVRTRATPQGDLDRVARQRQFVAALFDEVNNAGTWLNPFRVVSLASAGSATLTVGENDHVRHLLGVLLALRGGLEPETVPVGGFADTHAGNVVLWDQYAAPALWESLR